MATTLEQLQQHISVTLSEMDNTDYDDLMLQLAEWAQAGADLACLNWRGHDDNSAANDDMEYPLITP